MRNRNRIAEETIGFILGMLASHDAYTNEDLKRVCGQSISMISQPRDRVGFAAKLPIRDKVCSGCGAMKSKPPACPRCG